MDTLLETKRLILRPFTKADAQDLFELDSNPKVHKYLGNNPVKTIEQSKAMIEDILQHYKINGTGRLAIINKATHEFIGWCGIKFEKNLRSEFNYYDIGYRLKEQFWGKGYATEAAKASLKYGFENLNLQKICGGADVDHIASNTILKKIGMQHTGTFKFEGDLCNWYSLHQTNWDVLK